MLKINTQKIKKISSKFVNVIAKRSFISFLVLFFILLFISSVVFYAYGYLVVQREVEIQTRQIQINDKLYNQFLEYYIYRKDIFNSADAESYGNPFKP